MAAFVDHDASDRHFRGPCGSRSDTFADTRGLIDQTHSCPGGCSTNETLGYTLQIIHAAAPQDAAPIEDDGIRYCAPR